ncbi:hypothetical protein BJ878DRAFT_485823 [Calycina marina]|uniref:Uncharacterized protein n=1 Tax=Calycina marina TaxID=1763456 RepID=A0A9P8CJI3_9HELO|nr:hypothetical protein BJ878DRAFT_485823 [Calycina marina]
MTGYYNNVLKETHPRVSAINVYHSRSHQLHYEVFFMKRALAQQIPQDEDQAVIVRSILSMPNYPVNGRQNIPIVTSIPYNSPSMNLAVGRDDIQKVSGAYAQYFEEREQLDHMTIRESELNLLRTNAALVPVMDRFNYLISLHGLLKVQLGVNGDDLTGIAPYRPHVDEARTLEGIIQAFGRHRMQDAEEAHSLSSARTFTLYSQVAHLDC